MMCIMVELTGQITEPQDHITKHYAVPVNFETGDEDYLIRVKHSVWQPENAYVEVKYEDYWFYTDKGDRTFKNTFYF